MGKKLLKDRELSSHYIKLILKIRITFNVNNRNKKKRGLEKLNEWANIYNSCFFLFQMYVAWLILFFKFIWNERIVHSKILFLFKQGFRNDNTHAMWKIKNLVARQPIWNIIRNYLFVYFIFVLIRLHGTRINE